MIDSRQRILSIDGGHLLYLEDAIVSGRTTLLNVADTPLQGGVPIVVDGVVVGAVGVSGAASADQDRVIAEAGAAICCVRPQ